MPTIGSTTLSRMFTPSQLEMLRAAQDSGFGIIPTDLIKENRQAYNGLEKRGYVEGGGLTRLALNCFPMQQIDSFSVGGITIIVSEMDDPARLPEPPLDPEDTKPLPPIAPPPASPVEVDPVSEALETPQQAIQPLPECATCHKGYERCFRRDCPHVPCQARDWYARAYRYQRADTRYNIHVMDVPIDDVPIDVLIAARESAMARATPPVEPFILRAWYKKLLDARDALAHIPLHDNAAFNDAVLDFKCIKARYMKLEERWQLRQAAGARR